jgi:hypothetical protein
MDSYRARFVASLVLLISLVRRLPPRLERRSSLLVPEFELHKWRRRILGKIKEAVASTLSKRHCAPPFVRWFGAIRSHRLQNYDSGELI